MNRKITLAQRAENYQKDFPRFPGFQVVPNSEGLPRLEALWVMGNQYHGSGYYGSYPPGYLKRIYSLFPDRERTLHLFSGSVEPGENEVTFDQREDVPAMVRGDANQLSDFFDPGSFDLILADPPYTGEDAEKYGAKMINREKVLKQCLQVVKKNGWVIWLDQAFPNFRKADWHWGLAIGMFRSTMHRVRGVWGFRKK